MKLPVGRSEKKKYKKFRFEVFMHNSFIGDPKMAVSLLIMVRFSIRKMFWKPQVGRHLTNKSEMQFFYSISPKIGTSVAPPS